MTTNMELFSDYVCPWCYFMTGRIERLHKEYDISITWRVFPLHPETPEEGMSLDDVYARHPYLKADMLEHLRRNARALNMPYCERSKTFNSRLAQELGLWAEQQGKGESFHHAAFSSYFVHHENLAKADVLMKIVQKVGLDVHEAAEVLEKRTFSEAVERDWQRSRDLGITAVPTFVIGEKKLIGTQEYLSLANFVRENGVKRKGQE